VFCFNIISAINSCLFLWVSSPAYPNLLGTKRLCCCYCRLLAVVAIAPINQKGQPGACSSHLCRARGRARPLWVLCMQPFPEFLQEAISRTWTHDLNQQSKNLGSKQDYSKHWWTQRSTNIRSDNGLAPTFAHAMPHALHRALRPSGPRRIWGVTLALMPQRRHLNSYNREIRIISLPCGIVVL
jgi:hypothetical protein